MGWTPRSAQGRAIWEALHDLDHPTADEVFLRVRRNCPRISLGTVYRNLEAILRAGGAVVRDFGGVKRYDVNREPHIHLHDTKTDRLVDVPLPPKLQKALQEVAEEHLESFEGSVIELRGRLRPSRPSK